MQFIRTATAKGFSLKPAEPLALATAAAIWAVIKQFVSEVGALPSGYDISLNAAGDPSSTALSVFASLPEGRNASLHLYDLPLEAIIEGEDSVLAKLRRSHAATVMAGGEVTDAAAAEKAALRAFKTVAAEDIVRRRPQTVGLPPVMVD